MQRALLFVLTLLVPAAASAQTAREIVDKMLDENRLGFDTGVARVRLEVTDKNGRVKEQVIESKADKKAGLRRARLTFLDPADVRGTVLISLEQKGKEDLQYLYLPALRRSRRIAGAAKKGRFMGTDFTYADLEFRDARDGKLKRLGDATLKKRATYVIEARPDGEDEAYSRLKMWIDKGMNLPLKIEFYDRSGKLLKVLDTLAIRKRKTTGKAYASRLRMKNVQEKTGTRISVESLQEGAVLPDGLFDPSLLGR